MTWTEFVCLFIFRKFWNLLEPFWKVTGELEIEIEIEFGIDLEFKKILEPLCFLSKFIATGEKSRAIMS